jgi:hypothetical protein
MPSRLSDAFDRAADVLNDSYSEANEFGDVIPLKYFDPRYPNVPPHQWPVVMGEIEHRPYQDIETGETGFQVVCQAEVRTPTVVASGITGFQLDAIIEWNGQQWSMDEAGSFWDSEFVIFGLIQIPLVSKNECRSADV